MVSSLFTLAGLAFFLGFLIFRAAQSAIHEIEAFVLWLSASVFFSGAAIVSAVNRVAEKFETNSDNNNLLASHEARVVQSESSEISECYEKLKQQRKEPDNPTCSKCNVPMQIRTVTSGQHKGKQFYVCSSYPNCREMKEV